MLQKIKTKDLKVGMYVIISGSWMKHPFVRNRFVLTSADEINRIILSGIDEVQIDTARCSSVGSSSVSDVDSISHLEADVVSPPRTWEPEKLIPEELRHAIRDNQLPPTQKANIVYRSSLQMMERLLEDPKTENIREAKQGIAEIVDMIVADDITSDQLLRITAFDFYTYTHSVNVGVFAIMLAKSLFRHSDAHDMHELGAGFFLHDIGKIRIDPGIINKSGKLTPAEMKKMFTHPYQSYKILKEAGQLSDECGIIALQHHERDDGTGYPRRLKGDEIHLYGRVGCIADVYDALTAERSYKPRLGTYQALKVMKEEMLHHFQKDLFEKFVLLFKH